MTNGKAMTAKEREALGQAVRLKMRVCKAEIDRRCAIQKANMEKELTGQFNAEDEDLAAILAEARAHIDRLQGEIFELCKARGVRRVFAPQLHASFSYRGENAIKDRRAELRKLGEANIDAKRKQAWQAVEAWGAQSQIDLIGDGLTTADARAFLEKLPSVDALLPPVTLADIDALTTHQSLRLIPGETDHTTGTDD